MYNKKFNKIIVFSAAWFVLLGLGGATNLVAQPPEPTATPAPVKATEVAETPSDDQRTLDVSGMLGATIDPGNFAAAIQADLYTSPYLSLNPMVQVSFFDTRTFIETSIGGKFHLAPMELSPIELSYQAGVGYFYRRANGFDFHNFVFVTGPGVDIYLKKPWAFTAAFLVNVSNDAVNELFYTALAGVKYIF